MNISMTYLRKVLLIVSLLMVLLVTGCAGIEPYEPRNHREEGPERGLFTGSEGEFVIFRKGDEPESDTAAPKKWDHTAGGKQKK